MVVTLRPSDFPNDFQTFTDLQNKPEFYKTDPPRSASNTVPVFSTPIYVDMTAPPQKDTKRLAGAKATTYMGGFYNGTVLVGEFKEQSLHWEATIKVRDAMIHAGLAFAYAKHGVWGSRGVRMNVESLSDELWRG